MTRMNQICKNNAREQVETMVHIFCVDFRELSHLARDFSHAEKKINVVTS